MVQLNENVPTIMLLGRTNVGKSSLFNLLLGERQAIVSDIAGSTRDFVKREFQLAGYTCLLTDSSGFRCDDADELDQKIQEEAWRQREKSDLILLVLEAGSLTGVDEELLQELRPIANKVLLIVNKADTAELEMAAWDTLAYGFPHLQSVSVKRHRNIGQLRRMLTQHLQSLNFKPNNETTSKGQLLRLAFVGRPNSGKSTLLNSLAGTEIALVSSQAGTTRDALNYQGEWFNQAFTIIDTAGMRRQRKISQSLEYYALQRSLQALDEADVAALLIDAQQGITVQDKKIAARALEQGNALIFVINKIDLIDEEELQQLKENLRYFFPQLAYAPILLASAKNKLGCKAILKEALSLYNQGQRRIPTSQLNQAVADWQLFQPIPQQGGNHYKIRYIVQQDTTPPRFIVFVNIVKDFPSSYQRYLINQLRREFGFPCVPIALELRQRQTWPERQKQQERVDTRPVSERKENSDGDFHLRKREKFPRHNTQKFFHGNNSSQKAQHSPQHPHRSSKKTREERSYGSNQFGADSRAFAEKPPYKRDGQKREQRYSPSAHQPGSFHREDRQKRGHSPSAHQSRSFHREDRQKREPRYSPSAYQPGSFHREDRQKRGHSPSAHQPRSFHREDRQKGEPRYSPSAHQPGSFHREDRQKRGHSPSAYQRGSFHREDRQKREPRYSPSAHQPRSFHREDRQKGEPRYSPSAHQPGSFHREDRQKRGHSPSAYQRGSFHREDRQKREPRYSPSAHQPGSFHREDRQKRGHSPSVHQPRSFHREDRQKGERRHFNSPSANQPSFFHREDRQKGERRHFNSPSTNQPRSFHREDRQKEERRHFNSPSANQPRSFHREDRQKREQKQPKSNRWVTANPQKTSFRKQHTHARKPPNGS